MPSINSHFWTSSDLQQLMNRYPSSPTGVLAAELARPVSSVYRKAAALGLKKSAEFYAGPMSSRLKKGQTRPEAEAHQFRTGHIPANKGLRRPGWGPGRMKTTQFRKGNRTGFAAKNWRPVGAVVADTEGYLRIKIREAEHGKEATGFGNMQVWPLYGRHIWAQTHGPIPANHVIAFKDGDKSNCVLENLELISRADLARRNAMWGRFPRELAQAIQLGGALKRKIRSMNSGQE